MLYQPGHASREFCMMNRTALKHTDLCEEPSAERDVSRLMCCQQYFLVAKSRRMWERDTGDTNRWQKRDGKQIPKRISV